MIRSLKDAEKWYHSVKSLAVDMKRMASLWDREEIAEVLSRDNRLRDVTSADLSDMAATILDDLDQLAVLVLFSVFEATVRAPNGGGRQPRDCGTATPCRVVGRERPQRLHQERQLRQDHSGV